MSANDYDSGLRFRLHWDRSVKESVGAIWSYFAMPAYVVAGIIDVTLFGFGWGLLAFRLGMILSIPAVIRSVKRRGALFAEATFVVGMTYSAIGVAWVIHNTGGEKSAYNSAVLQAFCVAAILPIRTSTYVVACLLALIVQAMGALWYLGLSWGWLKNPWFVNQVYGFGLIGFLYVIQIRLRKKLLVKTLELEDAVTEREQVIGIQAEELAKTRVAAALGRAAQMLAHDVRKPLSTVRTLIDCVMTESDPGKRAELLEQGALEVDGSLKRVSGMIEDVMAAGSPRRPSSHASVSIDALMSALKLAHSAAPLDAEALSGRRVEFRVSPDALEHSIPMEGGRAERALSNVIDNALYASRGKAVWIEVTSGPGATLGITVGNLGSFIPEGKRSRIFEAFYSEDKAGGTGLGLAITKSFVEEARGSVTCESRVDEEHPDGITAFHFVFPTPVPRDSEASGEARGKGDVKAPAVGRRGKIVIVEDSVTHRVAWKRKLEPEVEVLLYSHPEHLFEAARVPAAFFADVSLVVTDYWFGTLSSRTGEDLASELRALGYDGPIVVSTNAESAVGTFEFDLVIGKQAMSYENLLGRLRERGVLTRLEGTVRSGSE